MSMAKMIIKKGKLTEVIRELMERYRVFAPVRRDDMTNFQELKYPEEADLSAPNTRLSPKAILHPQSECLFSFTTAKASNQCGIVREIEKVYPPQVILGVRPCDAKAFQLMDKNFDTPEYRDPWWVRRREATTLVGLACTAPCTTCFCTSVGTGPFSTVGLDVLMVDLGEEILLEPMTDKGKVLLAAAGMELPAPAAALARSNELRQAAEKSITSFVPTEKLKEKDLKALFNAPFWEDVQFACINCGVCTFVCPTCWCFDIQDEIKKNQGIRMRNWDACMFPLFTLHGSGHNPRNQKVQRVRQRFMHKLKYFVDKYEGEVACVGCGRCVQLCPVNIDIRGVFRLVNDFEGSAS
jgi:sulfhydrogenase subunit beta (sulfur reductase)